MRMGILFSASSGLHACAGGLISAVLFIYPCSVHAQSNLEVPAWSAKQLVEYQQHLHPQLKVQDVYKLFYEAAFGVGHILADSSAAVSDLMNELASLDSVSAGSPLGGSPLRGSPPPGATPRDEPLLEPISLNGDVVRVNLRPFKALNLSAPSLVQVMFQCARETLPDTLMFDRLWNEFSGLVRYGLLQFSADEVRAWDAKVEGGTIDRVHHSSEYSAANRPAYRVVRRETFEGTFGKISP